MDYAVHFVRDPATCGGENVFRGTRVLEGLSVRGTHGRTGIAAADFSRIRNADLGRFTINRLGSRVDVRVRVRRARGTAQGVPA